MDIKTKDIEKELVNLYYCSIKKKSDIDPEYAQYQIDIIKFFFKLLSIYTNENHLVILNKLYFTRWNIKEIGVKATAIKLYLEERTLFSYRKRYCGIINEIIKGFKETYLFNQTLTQFPCNINK